MESDARRASTRSSPSPWSDSTCDDCEIRDTRHYRGGKDQGSAMWNPLTSLIANG